MNFWEVDDKNQEQNDNIISRLQNLYGGKSEEALYAELDGLVKNMKANGTFDISTLENLYKTAYPFLNDEQRSRMRTIIDMLSK